MTRTDPRIADFERQVADLTVRVEQLVDRALVIRKLSEMRLDCGAGDRAGLKPSRSRHLMAVQAGRR